MKSDSTDGRPRVALMTDSASPSGVGEHMLTLARALEGRSELAFLLSDRPGASALAGAARAAGHPVFRVSSQHLRWWPEVVGPLLRAFAPDLIHVHAGAGWEGNRAALIARGCGASATVRTEHLPYVVTLPVQRREHALALAQADRVIFVSEAVFNSHATAGLPLAHAAVICNGVEPRAALRTRAAVRAELGLDEDAPVLLTVARFTRQKRHLDLLKAARAVVAVRPSARFVWAGTGRLRPELIRRVQLAGLTDHVLLPGARSDVPDLLAASDAFVLPSAFEGLPLALLEAMGAGLPVVATSAPGTTEVVTPDTGQLTPVGDPEALAAAMLKVLADPMTARLMGERARVHVRERFSAATMAEATWGVYQSALARTRGGATGEERRRA